MKAYAVFVGTHDASIFGSSLDAWGWLVYQICSHLVRVHSVSEWVDLDALVEGNGFDSDMVCRLCGMSSRVEYFGEVASFWVWRVVQGGADRSLEIFNSFGDAAMGALDKMLSHLKDVHGLDGIGRVERISNRMRCPLLCGFSVDIEKA